LASDCAMMQFLLIPSINSHIVWLICFQAA
jgi:hypothetical protein